MIVLDDLFDIATNEDDINGTDAQLIENEKSVDEGTICMRKEINILYRLGKYTERNLKYYTANGTRQVKHRGPVIRASFITIGYVICETSFRLHNKY